MQELIKVTADSKREQVVSARDLYEYLESKQQFADWIKNRIEKYGFVENQDFTTFSEVYEKGRPRVDYALTIDMAKELAMVEGNERGKQARQYFIECEKRFRTQQPQENFITPQTFSEALLLAGRIQAEKEKLEAENAKLAPKAEYTDKVLASVTDITTTTIAKELGMSAVKLNKILCEAKVQYYHDGHYVLYSKYQSRGYTETRTYQWYDKSGVSHTKHNTVWTERGRALVHSIVNSTLSFHKKRKEVSNG